MTSIIAVEIYRVTDKSKFKITMPDNVPPAVARSFESLTPTLIVMLLIGSITYYLGFDWHTFVGNLVGPLVQAADSLLSVLLLVFFNHIFLVLWDSRRFNRRIVGASSMATTIRGKTRLLKRAGESITSDCGRTFYQWFIWIGGAGATIGLAILLAFRAKIRIWFKTRKSYF
ncbi:PTS sugar transporter subunit IIC [Enterococcus faecalis]|uniref:PTS sugar transporter subunit IIC n=1 Tax=Enterococcus faecalis TaxID=1351 RepID=A0A974NYP4_ENTFL|nr:PTS sugar transporter subunit IIC [Enterococcus faecalis]